ncbi:MAG: GPMC system MBL fold metallohydrolase [Thermodesulfobacteriota bacterium]|nr:MAG: GPMC system MBL fold metallohydrolase [Thermodesulfobacteriota bacterium]
MKLLILGCGTSTGVPVIGCGCSVCTSKDPRNVRTRSSALVTVNDKNILIDTSTDLRGQALSCGIKRVDAVLFTHPHADHIHGIDDLRSFNMLQKTSIPCYGNEHTIKRIHVMFDYIFNDESQESWRPKLTTTVVDSPFKLFGTEIMPLEVMHGKSVILGYRLDAAAYVTDCSSIPKASMDRLYGLKLLIIGALRHKPHPTHMTIEEAVEISRELKPERTVLTHLSHNVDFAADNKKLPPGVELGYDGMELEV